MLAEEERRLGAMREEGGGLILDPYEKGAPCCYVDGPDDESEYELFQEDLDRLMPHIETAVERVPYFGEAGIKKVYNGAIAYTPDGNPIIGPAPRHDRLWLAFAHSHMGLTMGPITGQLIANAIDGTAQPFDIGSCAPSRYL